LRDNGAGDFLSGIVCFPSHLNIVFSSDSDFNPDGRSPMLRIVNLDNVDTRIPVEM
jgi:hypothetical protein